MSFAQGYADVSNRFRDLQKRDIEDAEASAGRMEKIRQTEIARQMPQAEALPMPTPAAAPAAPAVNAGAGNAAANSRKAHSALQSKKAPLPQDRAIEISETSNRLQAKNRADTKAQQDRRSMLTAPAAISDVLALPGTLAWNAVQGIGAVGRDVINRGANVVSGRDEYNTNNTGDYLSLTPFTDKHIRQPVQGIANDASTLKRLQGADQARIAETQGATPPATGQQASGGGANPYDNPTKYDAVIQQAAQQAGVDPALFKRLIGSESLFNPTAVSPRGAQYGYGIAQIAASHGLSKEQMENPAVALPFAANLLSKYIAASGGDVREGVLKYKGAQSEQGRAAMGQVYDQKIAGTGVPQQGAPTAAPQGQPQQPGGYSPAEMAQIAQQRMLQGQQQLDYINRMAQVTRDPAAIEKMRAQYAQVQAGMREAQLYNMVANGQITQQQFQQLSDTARAQQAALAGEAYKAQLKTQGEIAVEGAKGHNAMQLEQLRGTERRMAVIETARNAGYKITADPNSGSVYATGGGKMYKINPDGTATPITVSAGNPALAQDFMAQ